MPQIQLKIAQNRPKMPQNRPHIRANEARMQQLPLIGVKLHPKHVFWVIFADQERFIVILGVNREIFDAAGFKELLNGIAMEIYIGNGRNLHRKWSDLHRKWSDLHRKWSKIDKIT
jgi:hypothetical protein